MARVERLAKHPSVQYIGEFARGSLDDAEYQQVLKEIG